MRGGGLAPVPQVLELAQVDLAHLGRGAQLVGADQLAAGALQVAGEEIGPGQAEMELVLAVLDADGGAVVADGAGVVAPVLATHREHELVEGVVALHPLLAQGVAAGLAVLAAAPVQRHQVAERGSVGRAQGQGGEEGLLGAAQIVLALQQHAQVVPGGDEPGVVGQGGVQRGQRRGLVAGRQQLGAAIVVVMGHGPGVADDVRALAADQHVAVQVHDLGLAAHAHADVDVVGVVDDALVLVPGRDLADLLHVRVRPASRARATNSREKDRQLARRSRQVSATVRVVW